MNGIQGLIAELEKNGCEKKMKNAVALEFILYYIKDGKGLAPEFVRLFKTDTGYEIREAGEDTVLTSFGEDDITFGDRYADIKGGDWAGIHMSSNDDELMPFLAMVHDAYKAEPLDEESELKLEGEETTMDEKILNEGFVQVSPEGIMAPNIYIKGPNGIPINTGVSLEELNKSNPEAAARIAAKAFNKD